MTTLKPEIRAQIDDITIEEGRPLILCDADEVLFKFLEDEGYWIDLSSFQLSGNIKSRDTNTAVEGPAVKALIDQFFEHRTGHLEPVEGAAQALASLSDQAQIIILSNLPLERRKAREASLAEHGMNYPLVANQGLKGPPASAMAKAAKAPVTFLDDLPPNLQSVRQEVPEATLIHFVADPRLARMIGPAEASDHRLDTWPEVHDLMSRLLADS